MSSHRLLSLALLLGATSALSSCTLDNQEAPPLMGPSGFALSVTMTASPDRLQQDGVSQSVIAAVARGPNGEPINGLRVDWRVTATDGTFVEPSSLTSVTDGNGRAITVVTAPSAPSEMPATPVLLTVTATPARADGSSSPRAIEVELVPPAGTLPTNHDPVGAFTFSPASPRVNQAVSFNASATRDENAPCPSCDYSWDFGDGGTASGINTSHTFSTGGTFDVTLTVTDSRGGRNSSTQTVTVTAPTSPVAVITVSPTAPHVNDQINFDGSGSTVGTGATIEEYTWVFGDGTTATGASAQTTHTYGTAATYIVRLTIRDSLGRTATTTANVVVAP